MSNIYSCDELEKIIKKYVKGQDEYCKQLALIGYLHQMISNNNFYWRLKSTPLIIGDSGTGKTLGVETLCKLLDCPIIKFDSSSFSNTGYKGNNVNQAIANQLKKISINTYPIIIFDEIDKAIDPYAKKYNAEGALYNDFLKVIESDSLIYDSNIYDISGVTFIFIGSFAALKDRMIFEQNSETNQLGFFEIDKPKKTYEISEKDLINYGLPIEFIGRCSEIITLNPLNSNVIKEIIVDSEESILNIVKETFRKNDINLSYSETVIDYLANNIVALNLGARGINNYVRKVLNEMFIEVSNHDNVSDIRIECKKNNVKFVYQYDKYVDDLYAG